MGGHEDLHARPPNGKRNVQHPFQRALFIVSLCALSLACGTIGGAPSETSGSVGDERAISIAVVPFGLAAGSAPPPIDVAEAIRANLASADFATLSLADLPDQPTRLSEIRFETWRQSKADFLVVGLVASAHDGGHEVEFRLVDPREETTLVGFLVQSAPEELPKTADRIAEMIARRLSANPAGSSATTAGPSSPRDP